MKNMLKHPIRVALGAVVVVIAGLWLAEAVSVWVDRGPTAICIDAETGKPIEGAVALAQWFSAGGGGLFEGGVDILDKAEETFSDKDGRIYFKGWWGLHIFSGNPRLTVYKPGYVLWDSRRICPSDESRIDFDEKNRTVKLLKFDKEAPKWVASYPKEPFGPRVMQDLFFNSCHDSEVFRKYSHDEIKFRDIFYQNEIPLIDKEKIERSKKNK